MIDNFFTRCAIQDAPLLRLKEKILNETNKRHKHEQANLKRNPAVSSHLRKA